MSIMHHATPAGNSLAPRGRRPRSLRPAPSPRPAWSPPAPPESPEMEAVFTAVANFHAATDELRTAAGLRTAGDDDQDRFDAIVARHNEAEDALVAAIRRHRPRPEPGKLDYRGAPYWRAWVRVGDFLYVTALTDSEEIMLNQPLLVVDLR